MSKLNKIILVIIVASELAVGGLLVRNYINNSKQTYVTKIKNVQTEETESFKYYYEPTPNSIETEKPIWDDNETSYTINSDGFNETKDYIVEKPENTFRIITLGDSFTFGQFIDTKDNWTEVLETKLNEEFKDKVNIEVINLGVAGFDVPYITEFYKRKGQKYQPDLIVWFESGSGFFRYIELIKPIIEECEQSGKYSNDELTVQYICWSKAEEELINKYGITGLSNQINHYFADFFKISNSQDTIFVGFESSFLSKEQQKSLNIRLTEFPDMNYQAVIPNIYELEAAFPDGHPNGIGHEIISDAVYDLIEPVIKGKF